MQIEIGDCGLQGSESAMANTNRQFVNRQSQSSIVIRQIGSRQSPIRN
jgi:hypothetical protein